MSAPDSPLPLPHPPCQICCNDPECRLETPFLLAVYCRHRQSGAHFDGNRWTVLVPVAGAEYVELLTRLEERACQVLKAQQHAAGPMN